MLHLSQGIQSSAIHLLALGNRRSEHRRWDQEHSGPVCSAFSSPTGDTIPFFSSFDQGDQFQIGS